LSRPASGRSGLAGAQPSFARPEPASLILRLLRIRFSTDADIGGGRNDPFQFFGRLLGFLLSFMSDSRPAYILAVRIANAETVLAVLAFNQLNGAFARLLALGKGVGSSRCYEHDRPGQEHCSHELLHDKCPPKKRI